MKEVSVSILSPNNYLETINKLNNSNCDYIHYDVMDNKFVPNKFLSVKELVRALELSNKKNDIHLMVNDPSKYIEAVKYFNIDYISIHLEINNYLKYLNMIKEYGFKVGIAIKPNTNIEDIFPLLDKINLVLVMSVEPGFSGQVFIDKTKEKIEKLKQEITRRNLNVLISVDGGINDCILDKVKDANILVSSSFVLKDLENINILKEN